VPLRSKSGQGTISVVVQGDELDEAAGKATSRRVAEYYASAYYATGAAEGGGGRWAVAVVDPTTGLLPAAMAQLAARGVAPGQEWTQAKLEQLLRGEGRKLGTSVKVDRLTGEQRKRQVAKTDTWVFDVQKSVSLLAVYGYDQEGWLTNVVEDGARAGMEYLAQQTAYVRRRGADGQIERQRGAGIHYSLVLERTARVAQGPEDLTGLPSPHYHAHILIHGAFDRNGKYGAFDGTDALTSGHRQVASAIADLVVRQRLADRGIDMRRVEARPDEEDDQGPGAPARWEVASIPDRAVAIASERRRAILAARAEDPQPGKRGPTGDLAAERLTKARKAGVDDWPGLLRVWRRIIEDAGATPPESRTPGPGVPPGGVEAGRADGQVERPTAEMLAEVAERVRARFIATRPHFRMTELRAEILQEVDGAWERTVAPRLLSALSAEWTAAGELIPLQGQNGPRYAFAPVLRQEHRILNLWRHLSAAVDDDLGALAPAAVEAHEQKTGHRLDPGQRRLVEEALHRRAVIGLGVAGVGKTAAGDALRRAVEQAGRQVHSVAVACLRARETGLEIAAARDESVQAVLHALTQADSLERRYRHGDVLLVDEVSQLSDTALEGLLRAAERMHLHLVMLGDTAQQGAIGRGTMAAELMRRGGDAVVELREAHRFRDPEQAAALERMHDGDAWPWLKYAHDHGWLRPFAREELADHEILRLWQEDRERLVITMADNVRRDELNALIVDDLVARGEVSAELTVEVRADVRTPRRVELHEGQLVRLNRQVRVQTAPRRSEKVAANGEVARLEAIIPGRTPEETRVRLRFDEGRPQERVVEVEAGRLRATGAYVLQAYKSQGSTAERVVVDWADGRSRQQAYPTLSRQREEAIVVGTARDEAERVDGASALADRVAEAVQREDLSTPAVSMRRAEEWPAEQRVDARRAGIELPSPSPLDVRLWPDRDAETVAPMGRPVVPQAEPEGPVAGVDVPEAGPSGAPAEATQDGTQPALPAAGKVERPVIAQVLDEERLGAARRGQLSLEELTDAEFKELLERELLQAQLERLDQLQRVDREPDHVLGGELSQPSPPTPLPRTAVRDVEPRTILGEPRVVAVPAEPAPGWQATRAQTPLLERAEETWPEILDRKVAILDAARALYPDASRDDLVASFDLDLARAWSAHAREHMVSGASVPELDAAVLDRHPAAAELLLGARPAEAERDVAVDLDRTSTALAAEPEPVEAEGPTSGPAAQLDAPAIEAELISEPVSRRDAKAEATALTDHEPERAAPTVAEATERHANQQKETDHAAALREAWSQLGRSYRTPAQPEPDRPDDLKREEAELAATQWQHQREAEREALDAHHEEQARADQEAQQEREELDSAAQRDRDHEFETEAEAERDHQSRLIETEAEQQREHEAKQEAEAQAEAEAEHETQQHEQETEADREAQRLTELQAEDEAEYQRQQDEATVQAEHDAEMEFEW
jgi:AAA domain